MRKMQTFDEVSALVAKGFDPKTECGVVLIAPKDPGMKGEFKVLPFGGFGSRVDHAMIVLQVALSQPIVQKIAQSIEQAQAAYEVMQQSRKSPIHVVEGIEVPRV